jgi:hypothetical protein
MHHILDFFTALTLTAYQNGGSFIHARNGFAKTSATPSTERLANSAARPNAGPNSNSRLRRLPH